MKLAEKVLAWFGREEDFQPTAPRINRANVMLTLFMLAFVVVNREMYRPLVDASLNKPLWQEYLMIASSCTLFLWRVRFPLLVGMAEFVLFWVALFVVPMVGMTVAFQGILFICLYDIAAWARDRRNALLVLSAMGLFWMGWVVWDAAKANGFHQVVSTITTGTRPSTGVFSPLVSMIVLSALINAVYFGVAVVLGRNAWLRAYSHHLLTQQAATIQTQAEQLQEQAVVAERLRISRELHDVVAHHISAIGIQAGAARTVLDYDADQAKQALAQVEASSRSAVTEMNNMLGVLRETDSVSERAPEPSLAQLPRLIEDFDRTGLHVSVTQTAAEGLDFADIPPHLQLSLFRIIQEALTNVQRHSTARTARVALRTGTRPGPWVEAEVVDDGMPLPNTAGSGLGQLGMRERAASHGGVIEMGTRPTGGYRVRVRLPLHSVAAADHEVSAAEGDSQILRMPETHEVHKGVKVPQTPKLQANREDQ